MHNEKINFPRDLIYKIVQSVENAVGDDIREDIQRNGLRTMNSVPTRIWDLLNTNICLALNYEECTVTSAHRGPWEMVIIFEKTTQNIITFMREKRYGVLRKKQNSRAQMHYVDMLASKFNRNLLADKQLTLFPHHFSDEEKLDELVQAMLHDLGSDADIVRHHVLILFETAGFELSSIRAIKVTPSLDIAQGCEEDWTSFISANESSIVDKIINPNEPGNDPTHGLKLKLKATERKKNKLQLRSDEKSSSSES
jgi:hypothetical protein